VAIEFAWATVAQVSEADSARFDGGMENRGRGVGVTEADFDAERNGEFNCVEGTGPFGGEGQEQGIRVGDGSQLQDMLRRRIAGEGSIVRSVKARLGWKERALDMPAWDSGSQGGFLGAQGTKVSKAGGKGGPIISDECQQESAAAGDADSVNSVEQLFGADVVVLKINPAVTVHLNIK